MNVNTRAKTITPSASEKRWIDETYAMAETVMGQSFVDDDQTLVCDELRTAIKKFKGVLLDLAPKKEPKKTTEPAAK